MLQNSLEKLLKLVWAGILIIILIMIQSIWDVRDRFFLQYTGQLEIVHGYIVHERGKNEIVQGCFCWNVRAQFNSLRKN